MLYIIAKILKYTIVLFIITLLFGLVYYFNNDQGENIFYNSIYFSFCILLSIPSGETTIEILKFWIVTQKFVNNIVIGICAAFICQDITSKKPPIVLPRKLLLRRRTSPGTNGQIALAFVVGNEYGYARKLYDVTAKLTYTFNDGCNNANTQLFYSVQTIKNYNTFYFDINHFPPHFIDSFFDTTKQGQIDIFLHGKVGPYLHNFIQETKYSTADIIIAKRADPHITYTLNMKKTHIVIRNIKKYINYIHNKFIFKNKHIDLSTYIKCSNEEQEKILLELKSLQCKQFILNDYIKNK